MRQRGESGSIATLIGDGADAYRRTYYDSDWLRGRQLDPDPYAGTISRFLAGDGWSEPS
jgi:cysteine synthase A